MIIEKLFGEQFISKVEYFLKHDCKISVGFCSQKVGDTIQSSTSTAIVAYTLCKLDCLSEIEKKNIINELLTFQVMNGPKKGAFLSAKNITTWCTSQVCLALSTLKCEEKYYYDALSWLCAVQRKDGGWSYNGEENQSSRIIYSLYVLLALEKNKNFNVLFMKTIENCKKYILNYQPEDTFEKILKIFILKNIYKIELDSSLVIDVTRSFVRDIDKRNTNYTVTESDVNGHFYINPYLSASYLLLRNFIRSDNVLSIYMIRHLKDSILCEKGWAPDESHKMGVPYSWTTALAVLTLYTWQKDCIYDKVNEDEIVSSVNSIKEGDVYTQTFIERCPLNGGQCNKTNEINENYKDNKIFLDIPYDPGYLDFENQIRKTTKKSGLEVVVAKDTIKSKAVLCKICALIQSCKFGLADVSYSRLNIPFELGLMLGLSRNCVILKRTDASILSDISGLEYVEYQNSSELHNKLTKWIEDNK
jgi:hypothetical protein